MNIFTPIILGISLSMDAFSVSLFLGTLLTKKTARTFVTTVGLFHLILPLLGAVLGYKVINIVNINGKYVLGLVLLLLSLQVILSLFTKEKEFKITNLKLITLALSVALDSFSIGFGLSFENDNIIINAIFFAICSVFFTSAGLLLGRYTKDKVGNYAKIIGAILLLSFGIYHLFY